MAGSRSSAEDQDKQNTDPYQEVREKAKEAADQLGGLSGKAVKELGSRKQKIEDALRDAGA